MTSALATTVTRRAWLSRLLLAAAVAPVAGVKVADTADASKKGKKRSQSICKRAESIRETCSTVAGGTATVSKRRGGTTVECTGGSDGDYTCTVHSKGTRCHKTSANSPTDGVHEDPTDGNGGRVPPSDGVDDSPMEPADGGSDPVLE